MTSRRLAIFLLFAALALVLAAPAGANSLDNLLNMPMDEREDKADAYYVAGEYGRARKHYKILARLGSKYAQYRLSVMHLEGQGFDPDPVEAWAWAAVAAEFSPPPLVTHRDALWRQLDDDQRRAAEARHEDLMEEYADEAVNTRLLVQSRLRQREQIGRGLLPDSFVGISQPCDIAGGGGGLGAGSAIAGGASYGPCGTVRGPIKNPAARLQMVKMIEQVMEQRLRGENVELGEFEVIEDEPVED